MAAKGRGGGGLGGSHTPHCQQTYLTRCITSVKLLLSGLANRRFKRRQEQMSARIHSAETNKVSTQGQ